jgi:hypothetical protein
LKNKPLIINVRGNSGSGKTHLTREFMKLGKFEGVSWEKENFKLHDYLDRKRKWAVLGSYENTCGGCDTIKTQAEIVRRVTEHTNRGYNVWLEGLILSTIYGTVGEFSERFGDRWIFAYLDTPPYICYERILKRRKEAGNTKPFNQKNTSARFSTIVRNREIVEAHGRRTVTLPWAAPLAPLLKIVKKEAA